MNYFDLMKAITYAHVEAQGLPTAEADSASAIHGVAVSGNGAGTANSAPEYLLSAEIVDKVYSKERIDFEMRLLHRTREEL